MKKYFVLAAFVLSACGEMTDFPLGSSETVFDVTHAEMYFVSDSDDETSADWTGIVGWDIPAESDSWYNGVLIRVLKLEIGTNTVISNDAYRVTNTKARTQALDDADTLGLYNVGIFCVNDAGELSGGVWTLHNPDARVTITYNNNGGSGGWLEKVMPGTHTVSGQGNVYRNRYNYIAWNTDKDGGKAPSYGGAFYAEGDLLTINADTVFYAVWDSVYNAYIWREDDKEVKRGGIAYIPTFGFGKNYLVVRNINVSSVIGDGSTPFTGVFDGNEHTITMNINEPVSDAQGASYAGLFSSVGRMAKLKNFSLKGILNVSCASGALYAGAIAGQVSDCEEIKNISSEVFVNVTNSAGSVYAGGLVGQLQTGTITRCYAASYENDSEANLVMSQASTDMEVVNFSGGIVGECGGTVNECWTEGSIVAEGGNDFKVGISTIVYFYRHAGGIVGDGGASGGYSAVTIMNCVSLCGKIDNNGYAHRVLGGGGLQNDEQYKYYGRPNALVNGETIKGEDSMFPAQGANAVLPTNPDDKSFYTDATNWYGTGCWQSVNGVTFNEDTPWKWDAYYGVNSKGRPRMYWEVGGDER